MYYVSSFFSHLLIRQHMATWWVCLICCGACFFICNSYVVGVSKYFGHLLKKKRWSHKITNFIFMKGINFGRTTTYSEQHCPYHYTKYPRLSMIPEWDDSHFLWWQVQECDFLYNMYFCSHVVIDNLLLKCLQIVTICFQHMNINITNNWYLSK